MSIVIFAETWNQKFKKSSLEAVSYGSKIAKNIVIDAHGAKSKGIIYA